MGKVKPAELKPGEEVWLIIGDGRSVRRVRIVERMDYHEGHESYRIVTSNPESTIEVTVIRSRDRILTDKELVQWIKTI